MDEPGRGFAFDARADEETGNLFTIFGQPDVEISRVGDQLQVEIRGLDSYNPTTGEVVPQSTADIDEAGWSSLNSAVSRPFPVPDSGCIAIKVINHCGEEIMRVYNIPTQETLGEESLGQESHG